MSRTIRSTVSARRYVQVDTKREAVPAVFFSTCQFVDTYVVVPTTAGGDFDLSTLAYGGRTGRGCVKSLIELVQFQKGVAESLQPHSHQW